MELEQADNLWQLLLPGNSYSYCLNVKSHCKDTITTIALTYSYATAAGVPYEVVVVAFTSVGRGAENDYIVFFSEELTPTKSPENVNIKQVNSTSLNITWTPLTLFEARGFPLYKIILTPEYPTSRRKRQSNTDSIRTIITSNSFAVFTNLSENSNYSILVAVTTGNATSEFVEGNPIYNGTGCIAGYYF